MTTNDSNDVTRRTVLRAGAVTAGAVTIGAAGAAAHHDDDHDEGGDGENGENGEGGGSDEKRGGRAQVDDARRNEPFVLSSSPTGVSRHASCMSEESAQQTYLEYDIEYCESGDEATMYIIPDEAELAQEEVYEFRAVQECRATDNELVALGPSDSEC